MYFICANLILFTSTAAQIRTQWCISTSWHPVQQASKLALVSFSCEYILGKWHIFALQLQHRLYWFCPLQSDLRFVVEGKTWYSVESSDAVGNVGSHGCQNHSAVLLLFYLYADINAVICVCHLRTHSIICSLIVSPQSVLKSIGTFSADFIRLWVILWWGGDEEGN